MTNGNGSAKPTRDDLRAALLDKNRTKAEVETLTLFGQEVELRQPTLGSILEARDEQDPRRRGVMLLVRFACVPGTDERIFEEGDIPQLLNWPFGKDLVEVNKAVARLTGVDIDEAKMELQKNPLEGESPSSAAS